MTIVYSCKVCHNSRNILVFPLYILSPKCLPNQKWKTVWQLTRVRVMDVGMEASLDYTLVPSYFLPKLDVWCQQDSSTYNPENNPITAWDLSELSTPRLVLSPSCNLKLLDFFLCGYLKLKVSMLSVCQQCIERGNSRLYQ